MYSVYVTPPGEKEIQIASNYAFRFENRNRDTLDGLAIFSRGSNRSIKVCNLVISKQGSAKPSGIPNSFITPPPQETVPVACTPTNGDANDDKTINLDDFNTWLNNYNSPTSNGPSRGDFNCSGFVDGVDYVIWLNSYRPPRN